MAAKEAHVRRNPVCPFKKERSAVLRRKQCRKKGIQA